MSRRYVSGLRGVIARRGPDSRAAQLADLLLPQSAEFRGLWDTHEIGVHPDGVKRLVHPEVGALEVLGDRIRVVVTCPAAAPIRNPPPRRQFW